MKLVALVCLCLVTRCGITAAGVNGPVVKVFAAERSDVILPCSLSTKENIQSKLFDWKKVPQKNDGQKEVFLYNQKDKYSTESGQSETFKGRVSHFPDQLKYGNASITIRNTKETDSGNYTCEFPELQPPQKFYIELIFGVAPKPHVTSLEQTKYWSRLQCEVHGNPKPKVEWQDSDGNNLTAEEPQVSKSGDRYNVILQITVTKTNRYRCVATQETICHQIYTEIHVHISAVVEVVAAGSDVILPCSCSTKQNIQSERFDWKKDGQKDVFFYEDGVHYNNGNSGQDEQFKGRVSHFQDELKNGNASIIIRNTKVADSGNYTCDFPHLQPPQIFHIKLVVEDGSEGKSESSTGLGVGAVVGALFVGVFIGGLLAVLVAKGCIPLNCNKDKKKRVHQNTDSLPEVYPLTTTNSTPPPPELIS